MRKSRFTESQIVGILKEGMARFSAAFLLALRSTLPTPPRNDRVMFLICSFSRHTIA